VEKYKNISLENPYFSLFERWFLELFILKQTAVTYNLNQIHTILMYIAQTKKMLIWHFVFVVLAPNFLSSFLANFTFNALRRHIICILRLSFATNTTLIWRRAHLEFVGTFDGTGSPQTAAGGSGSCPRTPCVVLFLLDASILKPNLHLQSK